MKQFIYKFFLLFGTYSLVLLIRLGLWLLPAQLVSFFLHYRRLPWAQDKITCPVSTIVWAVARSASLPLGKMKCLGRALVTQTLMLLFGHMSSICFGVARGNGDQIEAHAWVDYQGQIIMGQLDNMSRFYRLNTGVTSQK